MTKAGRRGIFFAGGILAVLSVIAIFLLSERRSERMDEATSSERVLIDPKFDQHSLVLKK